MSKCTKRYQCKELPIEVNVMIQTYVGHLSTAASSSRRCEVAALRPRSLPLYSLGKPIADSTHSRQHSRMIPNRDFGSSEHAKLQRQTIVALFDVNETGLLRSNWHIYFSERHMC